MREIIESARTRMKFPQKYVAGKMFLSIRQYQRLVNGEKTMSPEDALRLADILQCQPITMVYCRKKCPIGQRYCYDLLNNVDLSPMAILSKYRIEEKEASIALDALVELFINKAGKDDCKEEELCQIRKWALELLDLEHVIETLKMRLWDFVNVEELIREHNLKCLEKRYVDTQKPELHLAG